MKLLIIRTLQEFRLQAADDDGELSSSRLNEILHITPDENRTFWRALSDLTEEYQLVWTPRGYVAYEQKEPQRCVSCGDELEERAGVRGRCGNETCVQPQHEVRCRECGTVFPIRPFPSPPGLGGSKSPYEDPGVTLRDADGTELSKAERWELRAKRPVDRAGQIDESWACPGCAAVWEPPDPWQFSDPSAVPFDDTSYEDLLDVIEERAGEQKGPG